MAYADMLLGLKALFLESPEAESLAGLLDARAPGLAPAERAALAAIPGDRLAIYAGLLRENQATMIAFVAPCTLAVADQFAGVSRLEFARSMLLETPRTSSRLRELGRRIVDHLAGPGAAWSSRCPGLLDLARLEREQTEAFYGPDDEGAMTPHEFAEHAGTATVEEVLALQVRRAAATRTVDLDHDVIAWRAARYESGVWGPPPARLPAPMRVLLCRDPGDLQTSPHVLPPPMLALLTSEAAGSYAPLEDLASAWVEAAGVAPDDPEAAVRFFEQLSAWVRMGAIALRRPAGTDDAG